MADINTTLKQKILDLPQRERIADVHHHCEANNLGRKVEISEGIAHHRMLSNATAQLKPTWSDKAGASDLLTLIAARFGEYPHGEHHEHRQRRDHPG